MGVTTYDKIKTLLRRPKICWEIDPGIETWILEEDPRAGNCQVRRSGQKSAIMGEDFRP